MEGETAEQRFGQRIKTLRNERGWSQQRLAEHVSAVGLPWRQTTVAKTEAAERPIRINEAEALARIFAVPLAGLFDPAIEPDDAYQLHGINSAMAELGSLQARITARLDQLDGERIDVEDKQAKARWRAQEGEDPPDPLMRGYS